MNILIIAKTFHSEQSARGIQMRRVINALTNYTDHRITLVTEGKSELDSTNEKLQIINISSSTFSFPFIEKIVDRLVCSIFCFKKDNFHVKTISILEKELKNTKFDLLLTVSTPFVSHLVGLEIKKMYPNLYWVSFFSDLWPSFLLPKPYYRKKILSKLEINQMRKVVEKCDVISTPSEYTLHLIKQHFKTNAKLKTIPHCINEEIIEKRHRIKGYIVHSGFLQKERINENLVDAINELAKENDEFKGLVHIGAYTKSLKKLMQEKNCEKIILLGKIPEQLSHTIQGLFEIGLIIEAPMGKQSPFLPSKITDCISQNSKLISITPMNSFLTDFSSKHHGFFNCCYEKNNIKECINNALNSSEKIADEAINYFHPAKVAKAYDTIFNKIK